MGRVSLVLGLTGALSFFIYFNLPPDPFPDTCYSTVVTDRDGALLGARISEDSQWRFPPISSVPKKYEQALIQFEDHYFRLHPGVNPLAILRALIDNIRYGRITSGGSTITMQVVRLSRHGAPRTVQEKLFEAWQALRLERRYTKNQIICMYASHAPFGGNVVGLEAAAWRYFGRDPDDLSWGEAATLAVLPNDPAGMHPGKNRDLLLEKRNNLLGDLFNKGRMDKMTYELACAEPLPDAPLPLPRYASHVVDRYALTDKGRSVSSTISLPLQQGVENILDRTHKELELVGIGDLCAVVLDVATGDILAYVGNASSWEDRPGAKVDIARSPRSTGSILKPLLYCALLQEGSILPYTLLPDTPVNFNGFAPQNFDHTFSGAVPADEALSRSLNVPSVHMLRQYGVPRFHTLLGDAGVTTLGRGPSVYGLSLILGGAEATLYDITQVYAAMARQYISPDGKAVRTASGGRFPLTDKTSLWYTLKALSAVNRPDEIDPRLIPSIGKVSWKTGTSYGLRDAWAVGVTRRYAVGVWAGNANGRGVPGLSGARTTGPVLFDILSLFPQEPFFSEPGPKEGVFAQVCPLSGRLATMQCPKPVSIPVPVRGLESNPCTYHKVVDGDTVFVLPPAMEWYYKKGHPEYKGMIVARHGAEDLGPMEFIYPEAGSLLSLPRQADGTVRGAVFNLAHRVPSTIVYWYLDDAYVGQTQHIHQLQLSPMDGRHSVTVTDEHGNTLSISFEVER